MKIVGTSLLCLTTPTRATSSASGRSVPGPEEPQPRQRERCGDFTNQDQLAFSEPKNDVGDRSSRHVPRAG